MIFPHYPSDAAEHSVKDLKESLIPDRTQFSGTKPRVFREEGGIVQFCNHDESAFPHFAFRICIARLVAILGLVVSFYDFQILLSLPSMNFNSAQRFPISLASHKREGYRMTKMADILG